MAMTELGKAIRRAVWAINGNASVPTQDERLWEVEVLIDKMIQERVRLLRFELIPELNDR